MIMNYGSFAFFFYIGLAVAGLVVLALILKRFTPFVQKTVILCIAFLNLFQHLFKFIVYPQYWGTGFTYINTAYNMCALLIITSPFVLASNHKSWKDFICCAGCFAGLLPLFFPTWYIGKTTLSWDFFRFYICHALLLYSSALPLVLKLHKLSWKNWWKDPIYFTAYLATILLNLVLCVYLGLIDGATPENLAETLYSLNPLWTMHPSVEFAWVGSLADAITPSIFVNDGYYVPILWYWYPICIIIAILGFTINSIADRKNFVTDVRRYKETVKNFFTKKRHSEE